MRGPKTKFAQELYAEKYLIEGEDFEGAMHRIANTLSTSPEEYFKLHEALINQRFVPAGRIQSAIGSNREVTPYNCFVAPTIQDSFVHGHNSIMDVAKKAATTLRLGGGIGYDFSTLRPRNAPIKKLKSASSGPISFMEVFDAICSTVQSAGHRRGAQMGILRVDHPDIEEFVSAKRGTNKLTHFNISVAITDEFMECVLCDGAFSLQFEGVVYKKIKAKALWDKIMSSNWDWAEPGVIFIDRINEMNNLWYTETISATNPCSEQPLPPNGACLLGSLNLVKYVQGERGARIFDMGMLKQDTETAVRAMDAVIDVAYYPLPEQKHEALSKRRMGLGVMGLANALEALGYQYGSPLFLLHMGDILKTINEEAYLTSTKLAEEKGAFPLFESHQYLKGKFIKKLPQYIRDRIHDHGIRNSHLTSIAPTGTISQCCDNISSGIEPVFNHQYTRDVHMTDGKRTEVVKDYAAENFGVLGKTSDETSIDEHLAVLCEAQKYVDSAISKTINVGKNITREQFDACYRMAWEGGAKGCATFRKEGKLKGILREAKAPETAESEGSACFIDPVTGKKTCE